MLKIQMIGILSKKLVVEKLIFFFDFNTIVSINYFLEKNGTTEFGKPISLLSKGFKCKMTQCR
jgi:hypothetical protein